MGGFFDVWFRYIPRSLEFVVVIVVIVVVVVGVIIVVGLLSALVAPSTKNIHIACTIYLFIQTLLWKMPKCNENVNLSKFAQPFSGASKFPYSHSLFIFRQSLDTLQRIYFVSCHICSHMNVWARLFFNASPMPCWTYLICSCYQQLIETWESL